MENRTDKEEEESLACGEESSRSLKNHSSGRGTKNNVVNANNKRRRQAIPTHDSAANLLLLLSKSQQNDKSILDTATQDRVRPCTSTIGDYLGGDSSMCQEGMTISFDPSAGSHEDDQDSSSSCESKSRTSRLERSCLERETGGRSSSIGPSSRAETGDPSFAGSTREESSNSINVQVKVSPLAAPPPLPHVRSGEIIKRKQ